MPIEVHNRRVLVFLREWEDEVVLCVNNLSRWAQPVELEIPQFDGWTPIELYGEAPFPQIGQLPYFLTLGPHSFFWFRLLPPGHVPREAGERTRSDGVNG